MQGIDYAQKRQEPGRHTADKMRHWIVHSPKMVAASTWPTQLVNRRILTFRMRPNPASVDTSDDPP